LFVHDVLSEGDGTRVDVRIKFFPRSKFLRPFAKPIIRLLARIFKLRGQFETFKRCAKDEWRLSLSKVGESFHNRSTAECGKQSSSDGFYLQTFRLIRTSRVIYEKHL